MLKDDIRNLNIGDTIVIGEWRAFIIVTTLNKKCEYRSSENCPVECPGEINGKYCIICKEDYFYLTRYTDNPLLRIRRNSHFVKHEIIEIIKQKHERLEEVFRDIESIL